MKIFENMSPDKRSLLSNITEDLRIIPGMEAVVLGGSYARGTQNSASDLDLGLYYVDNSPFSIESIKRAACKFAASETPTVTDFYGWGRWVNGGAWIHTPSGKVDFVYRSLDKLEHTIQEAIRGQVEFDYEQQPPYGFHSVIYLGETSICHPLFDPSDHMGRLKRMVVPYPPALKRKIIGDSLWNIEFALMHARNFAEKGDIYATVGCITRSAANLTQALFALNETYFITDKTAMGEIAAFPLKPADYVERLTEILSYPGSIQADLRATVGKLSCIWEEAVVLAGDLYQPKFKI